MITRQVVQDKLLAYLNNGMTLAQLVDWAENTFVDAELSPEEDIDLLHDLLMYLAAADTEYFPLTWAVISDFLEKLGTRVRVEMIS
jgi:hypothetical protein